MEIKKMTEDDALRFQKELGEFIKKKLGERPYQCMIAYVMEEKDVPEKKGKSIGFKGQSVGNINPSLPFAQVHGIMQNLIIGLNQLNKVFYGGLLPGLPPKPEKESRAYG